MSDKKLMSWSLRIQNPDYRHDYERYGNKITSIGLHEWDVDGAGNIAIYKTGPDKYNAKDHPTQESMWGIYIPGQWDDATTYDRYASGRTLFPDYIEPDMARWPHIEYFMQMVIFGPETVSKILDSTTVQDTFIANLKTVVARFRVDQAGNDLGYAGLEIDCEGSWSDSKWDLRSGDNVKYINLLKRIKDEVIIDENPDFKLRINAHAMWGEGVPDYFRFHDYKLFAESVDKNGNPLFDEVQIMSYDFSWSGSAPGPSTPLWWLSDIAEWVKQCFDPAVNPNAKCTIDKVWIGGAGYGRRWPIYDDDNYGSSVTYRNLVGWQNGYYITLRDGETGEMADQDFIPVNAFNDPNSDNQIMYPHVYDYIKARYMEKPESMGQPTTRLSEYNSVEFATAYSKNQHVTFEGIQGITGVATVSEPTNNVDMYPAGQVKTSQTATMNLDGTDYLFQGYRTVRRPYVPNAEGTACVLSAQPETVLTYTVNVPSAGSYHLVGLVSFPFYGNTQLGGHINNADPFFIGYDLPDYYPMMFKAVHAWDAGVHSFNAGSNTITIEGPMCKHGTIIFGFVICQDFQSDVIGGYLSASPTIQGYKKRDGSNAKMPNQLAFTSEVLQQQPRPAIMWEDYFRQWLTSEQVQAVDPDGNPIPKSLETTGLQSTTYYKYTGAKTDWGGGTTLGTNSEGELDCYATVDTGYSQGYWEVIEDADGVACARFDPDLDTTLNGNTRAGQLVLNYEFQVTNISIETQIKIETHGLAGIRFASEGPLNGYLFVIDTVEQTIGVLLEGTGANLAFENLGDRMYELGEIVPLKIVVANGKGRFYYGGVDYLGEIDLANMRPGGMGVFANDCKMSVYMMSLRTTERWETLERFSLIVDGVEQPLGEVARSTTARDEYGYLIYTGMDETVTRDEIDDGTGNMVIPEISLDYVFKALYFTTFTGKKDVQIKLIDAGLWFKMLYIGDAEGMSITYAGDNESFNRAMNIAVYDYGCMGIGLWVLGQADPRIYETLPDVVAWHE